MSELTYPRSKAEKEANARKLNAEADLAVSQTKLSNTVLTTELERAEQDSYKHREWEASDSQQHVIRFIGVVNPASVHSTIAKLVRWHNLAPECDITFLVDSPGGDITSGFHLYDTLLWLRREGHQITTIATGMAASMAGVLFQAGSERVVTPQASMLIHEASFVTGGSMGSVEDEVEYVKMLQQRILVILAERSTLSAAQIKRRWTRKNWWLMAEEILKLGFADSIE